MPELPEVETIVADLRPHLVGRTIVQCDLRFPSLVRHPEPELFVDSIVGLTIETLGRRGKYILAGLQGGAQLVIHLGMSGQLRLVDAQAPLLNHTHVILGLDDGHELRYRDPRRFGRLLLGTEASLIAAGRMPRLGPEPIDADFGADDLYVRLRRRRAPVKAVLLDQTTIAGVGNIYADESLHRARLRPDRAASSLSRMSVRRLHEALREALQIAIQNRGSSVDSYRDAWGEVGGQQEQLQVYGRAGEPCYRCGRPLSLIRIAGRSSVFCRRCQR
jgi:formamidopyrimidine-DNA glycosylase